MLSPKTIAMQLPTTLLDVYQTQTFPHIMPGVGVILEEPQARPELTLKNARHLQPNLPAVLADILMRVDDLS